MENKDYDALISKLDTEIETSRQNSADLQRRREDLERRWKQLREQIDGLQKRRISLLQLGRNDLLAQLDAALGTQQKDAADVRAALLALGPAPGSSEEALKLALGAPRAEMPGPQTVDPALRAEAMALIDEIEAGKIAMQDWMHEERGAQVRVWALRWRVLAERIGQSIARNDAVMRKAYAVIMETRERYPGLPFIEALDPRRHGEWVRELEGALKELPLARERAKQQAELEAKLERVRVTLAMHRLPSDAVSLKFVREATQAIHQSAPMRERLLAVVQPYRDQLGEEFSFLWQGALSEGSSEPRRDEVSGTYREAVMRILDRMMLRKEIGGQQASLEGVLEGVGAHAREAVELLIKEGVLLCKENQRERLISIDAEWMHAVNRFLEGHELGNAAVDAWCKESTQ